MGRAFDKQNSGTSKCAPRRLQPTSVGAFSSYLNELPHSLLHVPHAVTVVAVQHQECISKQASLLSLLCYLLDPDRQDLLSMASPKAYLDLLEEGAEPRFTFCGDFKMHLGVQSVDQHGP